MVLEQPKTVAKPRPNRALAPHDRGEYIEYASSEMLGCHRHSGRIRSRQFRYEGNRRHGRRCECEDCLLVRWLNLLDRVRKYEARDQIPPRLTDDPKDPRYDPQQSAINERTRPAIAHRQAVRARRYFRGDLPAWLYCVLAGLPNPRDDLAAEKFEQDDPPTVSAHAEMMEVSRVCGVVFYEGEGHCDGERDTWGEQRVAQMMRDAELGNQKDIANL